MAENLPPIRAVTSGPSYHWFGYYDKLQFDRSQRYVLAMEVGFEHRSPRPDDAIRVGMIDLWDGDRWIDLGESRAWCWQQGCMLQWRPGSASQVLWNDRQGDAFVCHVLDVRSGHHRLLPFPIYAVSPDGRSAVTPDFRRLHDTRPGYGYSGVPDPNRDVAAPEDAGIWHVDLETGRHRLIISLAQMLDIPWPHGDIARMKHWFNHLLWNPDGTRFAFLHRWRGEGTAGLPTRLFTAHPDGSDLRVVDDYGQTSHFIWRDPTHILAWAWHPSHGPAFYLYTDGGPGVEAMGQGIMTKNGHCSYLPGGEWILNDTYPDAEGYQHVYLYHVPGQRRHPLGRFLSPPEYRGEWRCDTHPRSSPDGRLATIDSAHGGNGRQVYLLDLSGVVDERCG